MSRTDRTLRPATGSHVTVRVADETDAVTLAGLAALDSAAIPVGPTLLAEIDGEAVAALPIAGGPAVADPFRRTSAAIALLDMRAAQIRGQLPAAIPPASYRERLRALIRAPRAALLR